MESAPTELVSRPQSWRFVDVVLISVVSLLVTLAASVGLAALRPPMLALTLGVLAFEAIGIFAGIYLLGLRRYKWHWDAVGMRPTSAGWVVIAIIAGLFCTVMTGLVTVMAQVALGQKPNNPQLPFLAPGGFSWSAALGMLALAGLVVPLAEELLFRGVLYAWLRSRLGIALSVVLSAAIFGLAHGDIPIAVGVAFMGVIQALIYEGSKSIWTTFIMHAINNSLKVLLLYALLAAGAKF